ncbi:hypothetical protein EDC50_1216 [Vulcaniibacterium tengchongense]|uniref:TPR repeat protein n=1 Tax=Vulcaniibacterium tengchongense TaxID=1273429 RepID=A0A3N4VJX9_9GAMM|nr:hypothetical protein EDC50_1216 [Vulcaniibacterium tengchongense]
MRWREGLLALLCAAATAQAGERESAAEAVLRVREESRGLSEPVVRAQAAFSRAHALLGQGVDFGADNCARAEPDLREALERLRDLPARPAPGSDVKGFASLQLGRCRMAQGRDRDAARLLREAERWGNAGMVAQARACLAGLYAQGRGVERDPERALALYVLADGEACDSTRGHDVRSAAELILTLNPDAGRVHDGVVYALLRRGSARDWLRMLELHKRHFSSAGTGRYIPLALDGLYAGGAGEEDRAAMRELSLELGRLFLERGERALALGYLRLADPAAAGEWLRRWDREARYRLILADGREWRASDAVP